MHGGIYQRWQQLRFENGQLGYPTSDQLTTSDGGSVGRFSQGAIFARRVPAVLLVVHGAIYAKYKKFGLDRGVLGLPETNEEGMPNGGRVSQFENGIITAWAAGVFEVHGAIYRRWDALGFWGMVQSVIRPPTNSVLMGATPVGSPTIGISDPAELTVSSTAPFMPGVTAYFRCSEASTFDGRAWVVSTVRSDSHSETRTPEKSGSKSFKAASFTRQTKGMPKERPPFVTLPGREVATTPRNKASVHQS